MSEAWTVRKAVLWTAEYLRKKGADAPRTDADVMLAEVLGVDRLKLLIDFDKPLSKDELTAYRARIERRASGEPLAYVVGKREFYGRTFTVDARVLVPRPETEGVVKWALEACPESGRVLDLCAGSGAIGLTIAAERPDVTVDLVELDTGAAEVCSANARALGVADRCTVRVGDLFTPAGDGYAVLVSNPPYVRSDVIDGLSPEVRREPRLALDGGPDGLAVLRRITAGARARLVPDGALVVEIGDDQGEAAAALAREAGFEHVRVERDWAGKDRVLLAR